MKDAFFFADVNAGRSIVRRIASARLSHANRTLPRCRVTWGNAMEREIHYIENDFVALGRRLTQVIRPMGFQVGTLALALGSVAFFKL